MLTWIKDENPNKIVTTMYSRQESNFVCDITYYCSNGIYGISYGSVTLCTQT